MATKRKAAKPAAKRPAKASEAPDVIRILLSVCAGCLRGCKKGKESETRRWFFKTVSDIITWAREHGYGGMPAPSVTNPFVKDSDYMGEITVRQLMEVVSNPTEFPKGLDTVIRIGDVEGNNGVNGNVCLTSHKKGDVILSIDPNEGDNHYYQPYA